MVTQILKCKKSLAHQTQLDCRYEFLIFRENQQQPQSIMRISDTLRSHFQFHSQEFADRKKIKKPGELQLFCNNKYYQLSQVNFNIYY